MRKSKYTKMELRLPTTHIDFVFEVAKLARVKVDDVVSILLAIEILHQGKKEQPP